MKRVLLAVLLGASVLLGAEADGAGGWKEYQAPEAKEEAEPRSATGRVVVVGMVLVGLSLALFFWAQARSQGHEIPGVDHTRADPRRQRAGERQRALESIAARDPAFTPEAFLDEARAAFLEIRDARNEGVPGEAARLMSDGLLRRFLTEVRIAERVGKKRVVTGLNLVGCELVAAECDQVYDVLHVSLSGAEREAWVPVGMEMPAARAKAAAGAFKPLDEVWSFVRRLEPGQCKGRLVDGKCPSCGAPVARSVSATCEYCSAVLNSGLHDWVLAEVSNGGDFFCRTQASIRNWPDLLRRDARVNRQVLEDRASLVFWKWVETRVAGTPERFERLCTPEAFARLEQCSGEMPRGFDRVELGDVHLTEVACEADRERAHLTLSWRTARESWELPRKSVLTLERRAGVRTREDTGLATDRCHGCAGPQKELDAVRCGWCGALLPNDWSFVDCAPLDEFYATRHAQGQQAETLAEVVGEAASPHEALRLLAAMTAMVRADGAVRESERALMERCAQRWGVPSERVGAMLAAPLEQLTALRPRGEGEARRVLRGLVAAAFVDGGVGASERRLLGDITATLRLAPEELDVAVTEVEDAVAEVRRVAEETA